LLDDARTAVVACATVSLGTAEAAWTSFTGTAAHDRAMVCVTTVNCGATKSAMMRRISRIENDISYAFTYWSEVSLQY
jgi:hypothetical protein